MFILADTASSIEAVMGAAVDTTAPSFVVAYADHTTAAFTPGSQDGVLTGTTELDIVSPPASATQREVKNITIHNADAVSHTVTITFDDGTNERHLGVFNLAVGQTLYWSRETGWQFVGNNQLDLPFLTNYIGGLVPSNAADAAHDITVSPGTCINSDNDGYITLASAITKQIDAAWAEGNNVGGLDTGLVAANTIYHMHVIKKNDGTVDALFSTSLGSPTLPADYVSFRRVYSFKTDVLANLKAFTATEIEGGALRVIIAAPVLDINVSTLGTIATTFTLDECPTGVKFRALITARVRNTTLDTRAYLSSLDANDEAATTDRATHFAKSGATVIDQYAKMEILTNTSAQFRGRANQNNTTFSSYFLGFDDFRRG